MNDRLVISKDRIAELCRRRNIRRLAIFGSALRDDFGPQSDVDVLVNFIDGHVPGFFGLFDIEEELSAILGHKADVRTPEDLSKYFRQQVIDSAEVQYVQG